MALMSAVGAAAPARALTAHRWPTSTKSAGAATLRPSTIRRTRGVAVLTRAAKSNAKDAAPAAAEAAPAAPQQAPQYAPYPYPPYNPGGPAGYLPPRESPPRGFTASKKNRIA